MRVKKLFRATKRNWSLIIGSLVVAIGIIVIITALSGVSQIPEKQINGQVKVPMTSQELPKEVVDMLESIKRNRTPPTSLSVTRWEIDEKGKNIVLYRAYMREDLINELQGKNIAGWTITVVEDTEYLEEIEFVREELMKLEKNPKLHIAGFVMSNDKVDGKVIYMWVYEFIPENQGLEGMKIRNWTIHTFVSPTPNQTPRKV